VRGPANEKEYAMSTQAPAKTKLTWEQKLNIFAGIYGPFTTTWDQFRSFRLVEGFLEVYWPGLKSNLPPLIEIEDKPRCACCGSARPMFLRILTDRNGQTHMVGQECCSVLIERKQLRYTDYVSPIPDSEDKAR
jgi:hypothetical protein